MQTWTSTFRTDSKGKTHNLHNETPSPLSFHQHMKSSSKSPAQLLTKLSTLNKNIYTTAIRDAMQIAARNGSIPMLELLSLNGGSITTKGIIGDSLFQLAASNGHLAAIKWLNRNGLVEVPDTTGNTAVHVAARRVEPDILRYLDLDMGCCFVQANDEGQTPEDCIPRRFVEMEKLDKCRELVKNTVIEAGRRESEEELAAFNRKAPGHHLSSNSRELDSFKAGLNQR